MQLFDQLKEIVIDLGLVTLCDLFLFFPIHMHLSFKHRLAVGCPVRRRAAATTMVMDGRTPGDTRTLGGRHSLQGPLRYLSRHHSPISCLLLDCEDHLAVPFRLPVDHFWHAFAATFCVLGCVWGRVEIGVLLRLVLHLELREEGLFELGLLGGADRLAGNLLHVVELVEQVLVEVVTVVGAPVTTPEVHVFISSIGALVA